MKYTFPRQLGLLCALGAALLLSAGQVAANGYVGDQVNHMSEHLDKYEKDVNWMIGRVDKVVHAYKAKDGKAVSPDTLVDDWESVDIHPAIETHSVAIYGSIWQGIYGVKSAIDEKKPVAEVRKQKKMLEHALWQALGAVKIAAQYQKQGLLPKVETTSSDSVTQPQTIDIIKERLNHVVATYAEKMPDEATDIVHDTYLHLFEGVEGALIEQDAELVEDLEKDFNVTLPKAIKQKADADKVRKIVKTMQGKLDRAKSLLKKSAEERKDVF